MREETKYREKIEDKKIILFFTYGMSLRKWVEEGMLSREVEIYNRLAQRLDEVIFLSYGQKEEEFESYLNSDIKVLEKKIHIGLIYSLIAPLIHLKELMGADLYKTNQILGSWTAVIAKILFRKKLVVRQGYQLSKFSEGGNIFKKILHYLMELFAYKVSDEIIVTSEKDKRYISERYSIEGEKITVIPNYIDTEVFKPLDMEKKDRIIFVGRFVKQKNLFTLLEAVKGLSIELLLVGDGPLKSELKEKVEMEEMENVKFSGKIPNEELPGEYNKSKLFILPSLYEGNPKTLLEAMACGLPCIGTNVEGIKEIIDHKENGYLIENHPRKIRESIQLLSENKKLRKNLGSNAREYILDRFSLEKVLEKELECYR